MAETTSTEKVEIAVPTTLKALIEALIFAAQEPLSITQIKSIYLGENRNTTSRQLETDAVRKAIDELNKEYAKAERPYHIVSIAGGYQFATIAEYAEWIGKLYREQGRRKLSQSGVETLAIIAYKQPITKSEIEKIRGVNCDYVLKTLLEKDLVTIVGRAEAVGRPLLYGTTKEFLMHFGLNDLTDLPRPREIEEILGESQFETERRMLEAQAGAEAMKQEAEQFKSRLPHIPKKKSDLEEKDASIAPHKKAREIKILSADEKKALEEAGQTPIEFQDAPDTSSTAERPENASIDAVVEPAEEIIAETDKKETETSNETHEDGAAAEIEIDAAKGGSINLPIDAVQDGNEQIAGTDEPMQDTSVAQDDTNVPVVEEPVTVEEPEIVEEPIPEIFEPVASIPADSVVQREPMVSPEVLQHSDPVQDNAASHELPSEQPVELTHEDQGSPDVQDVSAEQHSEEEKTKPRWRTWKEKIQGFIKKLFA